MLATSNIPLGRLAVGLNTVFPLPLVSVSTLIICGLISSTRPKPSARKTTSASLAASFFIPEGQASEGATKHCFTAALLARYLGRDESCMALPFTDFGDKR